MRENIKRLLGWDELLSGIAIALALAGGLFINLSGQKGWILVGGAMGIAALILIAADSFRQPKPTQSEALAEAAQPAEEKESIRARFAFVTQMGTLAAVQQAWVAAEGFFEEALALAHRLGDPTTAAEAHHNYAVLLAAMGRPAEAEAHYQEALRLRPDFPETHNNYAVLLAAIGRPAEAHYQEALRLRPDFPEAHNNYALLLAAMGRPAEAEAHYQEALRLRPDDPEAHNNYANLLAAMGRPAEAEGHYQEALSAFEGSGDVKGRAIVLHNWGVLAAIQQQWDRSVERLTRALETFRKLNMPEAEITKAVEDEIKEQVMTPEREASLRRATIMTPMRSTLAMAA